MKKGVQRNFIRDVRREACSNIQGECLKCQRTAMIHASSKISSLKSMEPVEKLKKNLADPLFQNIIHSVKMQDYNNLQLHPL